MNGNTREIWVLTEYEYNTYSYSGISEQATYYHATKQGAEAHAAELGLSPVEYCTDPNRHCTISAYFLMD